MQNIFNFATSLSKDHAVLAMLFGLEKPIREIPEEQDEYDPPSLIEILNAYRESADAAYANAVFDGLADDIIAEKLAELQQCNLEIEKAHNYLCRINDELAKGKDSELRLDGNGITIISLHQWAQRDFNINLLEPIETEEEPEGKSFTSLEITFAFLVELFAETDPEFQHNGKPNASKIAKHIFERAKDYKKSTTTSASAPSQGYESIRNRISDSIKTRNEDY